MSLVANIGVLAVFKYYNFFIGNLDQLLHWTGNKSNLPLLKILLPIGLSFHTFQAMSYTIEVYRKNQKAERHFGIYALYVMFYPQLVAGPIERPQNMLHQFHEPHYLNYDNLSKGLRLMLWGMIKKVVIADRLALYTENIFNHPYNQSATALVIAVVFFTFQIFCDFSGYSDIAVGAARVMGYRLMINFNWPYSAKSVSEFWRRWHISLSTWLSDYVFTPLSLSLRQYGILALVIASAVTFFISGLWHGAAWHYVIWGGLHGVAIAYEIVTHKARKKIFKKIPKSIGNAIGLICTFSYVACSYIFFRANNMKDALFIIKKIAHFPAEMMQVFRIGRMGFLNLVNIYTWILPGSAAIVFLELAHILLIKYRLEDTFSQRPAWVRWAVYYSGFILLVFFGTYEKAQFIYYQF